MTEHSLLLQLHLLIFTHRPMTSSLQQYSVNQYTINHLLNWVSSGEIAIPEIQRPFVWKNSKVRDLLDSLYKGYPVGYVISWQNPNVRLKDGSLSMGKKILIDGQQRVTALRAALLGQRVLDKNFKEKRIRIDFNPIEEKFAVSNASTRRDPLYINNLPELFEGGSYGAISGYMNANPTVDQGQVERAITALFGIRNKQIGMIELAADLDIEMVTEIFIRINSQGVTLNQADFAMSKIASDEQFGGVTLRKAIDYFSNLAINPEFVKIIEDNDPRFATTEYFQLMRWLGKDKEDIYDPSYTDVLRVAYGLEFHRAVLRTLVSRLSGRNPETRKYEVEIAEDAFARLDVGVRKFFSETQFKRFVMTVKSAGFVVSGLIRSQNALNFAYYLYLTQHHRGVAPEENQRVVRRWLAMSILTGRAVGSFESEFDRDMRAIRDGAGAELLAEVEAAELGDGFWRVAMPRNLETSSTTSPYYLCYLAAQAKTGDRGFLSDSFRVQALLEQRGDNHHVYPKAYLKDQGYTQSMYNQVANLVYMEQTINIAVGRQAPDRYFTRARAQVEGSLGEGGANAGQGVKRIGGIRTPQDLRANLHENAIPETMLTETMAYEDFLVARRVLMAERIRGWYEGL